MSAPDDGVRMPGEISMRLVEELLPYARNSRTHSDGQVEILAKNIKRFGWTNPVLVADSGIIAGHGRILAAKKLGLVRVPCIDLSHLSADDRRALIISDNRISEMSGWSLEDLKVETDYLREVGFDLEADLGFAEDDLAGLLAGLELPPEDTEVDPDAVPDVPKIPVSVLGDIWVCGEHRVACMDALSLPAWDRLMEGEQARLCVTDPPYNVNFEGTAGKIKNDNMKDGPFREFLKGAFDAMFVNMEAGAPLYVAHADTEGFNFRGSLRDAGFKLSGCLVWCKQALVLGRSDWQWRHEPIIYLWKPGAAHFWYGGRKRTTILEFGENSPFQRLEDGRWAVSVGGKTLIVSGDAEVEDVNGSVIYHDKPSRSELHPTTKPTGLWRLLIEPSSRPGDIVIDPFSGSGTTLITCEMMGRRARVADLEEKFVDVAVIRWQMLTGRRAVHAVTGEFFPAEGEVRTLVDAAEPVPSGSDVF